MTPQIPRQALVCPIPTCDEVIEIPTLDEVGTDLPVAIIRPGETVAQGIQNVVDMRMAQHYAATDALVMAHFEVCHTIGEFAEALGTARNALEDIHRAVNTQGYWDTRDHAHATLLAVDEICHRGLGQQQ